MTELVANRVNKAWYFAGSSRAYNTNRNGLGTAVAGGVKAAEVIICFL